MEKFVIDGLLNVFSTISNQASGLGTKKDTTTHLKINKIPTLTTDQLEILYYQTKIIEKIVDLLPQSGLKDINIKTDSSQVTATDIKEFLKDNKLNLVSVIEDAAIQGRLYGDAFIILGLDDSQNFNQPVNLESLTELNFTFTLTTHEVSIDYNNIRNPEFYHINAINNFINTSSSGVIGNNNENGNSNINAGSSGSDASFHSGNFKFHKSRVLRFPGKIVRGKGLLKTSGYNLSVIQSVIESFNRYSQAMLAITNMLDDHAVFVYKLAGLAQKIGRKLDSKLLNRVTALVTGKSVTQSLVIDKDAEDVQFVTKSYTGLDALVLRIQEDLITASGMPKSKLLGSSNQSAFSEGGAADAKQWAALVSEYQNTILKQPYTTLCKYISAILGDPSAKISIEFPSILQLTEKEIAEIEGLKANAAKVYIESGMATSEELRGSDVFFGNFESTQERM